MNSVHQHSVFFPFQPPIVIAHQHSPSSSRIMPKGSRKPTTSHTHRHHSTNASPPATKIQLTRASNRLDPTRAIYPTGISSTAHCFVEIEARAAYQEYMYLSGYAQNRPCHKLLLKPILPYSHLLRCSLLVLGSGKIRSIVGYRDFTWKLLKPLLINDLYTKIFLLLMYVLL
jgi:hypothetical protein